MNDNFKHLILGRLQEVSQLYADRVVNFIASDKFPPPAARDPG